MLSFSSWLDFIPIYAAKKWEQNPVHSYFYLLNCAKVFLPVSTPPPLLLLGVFRYGTSSIMYVLLMNSYLIVPVSIAGIYGLVETPAYKKY